MNYLESLQHPLWQEKRSDIMIRDSFRCQCCHSKELMLSVHHLYYKKRGTPSWDYDNECLVTLCKNCHDFAHNELPKITALLAYQVLRKGVDIIELQEKIERL